LNSDTAGTLVPPHSPGALGAALQAALHRHYDPAEVARIGTGSSWEASAEELLDVLKAATRDQHP
jgi:hypothetical protein